MFKNAYRVFIVLACAIAGCSGSPKELPVAKSAHGGTMLTLPDGQSYAEVLVESAVVGKSAAKLNSSRRSSLISFRRMARA